MQEHTQSYPGEAATHGQIMRLAEEYRRAAQDLAARGRRGEPLSLAPARLSAIHAIELYLNAYLLRNGHSAAQLRGLQHDFAKRTELATAVGLRLRVRTEAHLKALAVNREYVGTRYAPLPAPDWSPPNRLFATLEEIASKVTRAVAET